MTTIAREVRKVYPAFTKIVQGIAVRKRFPLIILWLIPILGLLFFFSIAPIIASFGLSFFNYDMLRTPEFVSAQNYQEAFHDPVFKTTLRNTAYYAILTVPIGIALALFVAQLIHSGSRFKSIYRVAYFVPVMTPSVAAAIVWRFIYQPQFGLLHGILAPLGLATPNWLNSSTWVVPALAIMTIWAGLGYNMVLFLAGLVGIPTQFYEAAKIDGANGWQMFWSITWPLLRRTVTFVTVTSSIGAFQLFAQPYVMTRGGPEDSSRTIVMYIQEQGFDWFRMGYASSLAYILFAIVLMLTLLQLRYMRTEWGY